MRYLVLLSVLLTACVPQAQDKDMASFNDGVTIDVDCRNYPPGKHRVRIYVGTFDFMEFELCCDKSLQGYSL